MTKDDPGIRWKRMATLALLVVIVALLAGASQAHRSRVRTQPDAERAEASAPVVPLSSAQRARIAGGPPMGALGPAHGR